MSRLGAIVRRLYGDEVKPAAGNSVKQSGRLRRKLEDLSDALSRRPTVLWIVRVVVILLALVIAAEGIFQYNRLQTWHTSVQARRADVDRELKRRKNLIPGVVALAGKYADYERGMFKYISDARGMLQSIKDSQSSGGGVSNLLEKALSRLVALAEAYPDLKATQPVQDLIAKLAETEDRIAQAKKEYNAACEQYNQYRTTFPGNVFAFVYRYKFMEYIGLDEEMELPVINLDITERGPANPKSAIGPGTEVADTIAQTENKTDAEVGTDNLNKSEGVE